MALLVQNDSGTVVGANAYVSVDEFKAYHDARGNDYSAAADDSAIEKAIVRATAYVDTRFTYTGLRMSGRDQDTQWPRTNAFDRDRYSVIGIPPEVKNACCEYALRSLTQDLNPDPTRDDTGALVAAKSETVGPITESTTYVSGAVFALPRYPAADQWLIRSGLVRTAGQVARG